ncbi:MAG: hypothetical protein R3258_07430 [Acidimicrobiia bacterium]|nr:hypothetical protein [Acidimicrobiia bacterium]
MIRETRPARSKADCGHKPKTYTEIAGIKRAVCDKCGSVSIDFARDVFAEERKQLEREEA